MITTRQMIPLRPLLPALTLFTAGELFKFPMKLLNLPTHVVRLLSDLRGTGRVQVVGDDPVNVAVCGYQLEQFYFEGNLVELVLLQIIDLIFQLAG